MATVTSLTADRMLAIEAASVVDGDVVGDNLILTKHDGSQINAGSVRGPAGPQGPVGTDLSVLAARTILHMGLANQIRAGRQLTATDFTSMGLSAPLGLWNLSDLSDSSGYGRSLLNKGAVPFVEGIHGLASTAARFRGDATQALYIPDSGAGDPFRMKTGSWGGWFKTARSDINQTVIYKTNSAFTTLAYGLLITNAGQLGYRSSVDGLTTTPGMFHLISGPTFVADDRWHFAVCTNDGIMGRIYLDGRFEVQLQTGPMFTANGGPLNIGAAGTDAATTGSLMHAGRLDEVFVTADVLTEDQVRLLYCAKIAHTLGAVPTRVSLNVRRRRRGATLVVADFAATPLRLYNFSGGSLGDEGLNNAVLTNNGGATSVAGVDGVPGNAFNFYPGASQNFSGTDTGLPNLTSPRSFGCWIKTVYAGGNNPVVIGWGNAAGNSSVLIYINSYGALVSMSGSDTASGPFVADGEWHHVVVTETDSPIDGMKRKLYCDGRLVNASPNIGSIGLLGANGFRIGARPDAAAGSFFPGEIDGAFVTTAILTQEEIVKLFIKGSQTLAPSPKNPGDHIEALSATDILATFDSLSPSDQVDLLVAA